MGHAPFGSTIVKPLFPVCTNNSCAYLYLYMAIYIIHTCIYTASTLTVVRGGGGKGGVWQVNNF